MVNSKTIATVAASVALSLLGAWVLATGPTGPQGPAGKDGLFGALAGPDIPSPYLQWGGVRQWHSSADLMSAGTGTSTLCAIVSPSATTTLVAANIRLDSAPHTSALEIYRAAQIATKTTLLAHKDVGTTHNNVIATTSVTALTDGVVIPNSYINFVVSTTTTVGSTWNPTGLCSAVFREI